MEFIVSKEIWFLMFYILYLYLISNLYNNRLNINDIIRYMEIHFNYIHMNFSKFNILHYNKKITKRYKNYSIKIQNLDRTKYNFISHLKGILGRYLKIIVLFYIIPLSFINVSTIATAAAAITDNNTNNSNSNNNINIYENGNGNYNINTTASSFFGRNLNLHSNKNMIINIKQLSQSETGLETIEAKKADKDQKVLMKINHNKKRLFVIGNYCSGTRWLNYLIIKNTPTNHLYALRNQNEYLDDNNNVKNNFKHGILKEELLNQKHIVIIYIIRDFDDFLNSFLKNSHEEKIENGIVLGTNMNVYQWYCHMIESNISSLKNSESNYIIVSMNQIQKTKGVSLLNILETNGFEFRKPYDFIDKHTRWAYEKRKTEQNQNYSKHKSHLLKFERNNTKIENILKTLAKQPEIKISWK